MPFLKIRLCSLSRFIIIKGFLIAGTLWCGGGDKARSNEDLGRFKDTDACCREHDFCQDNILAGEEKHGLINGGLFTRLDKKWLF